MNIIDLLFGRSKPPKSLAGYPITSATLYGKTFNDWRRLKGFKLVERSVPSADLLDYCRDCGWPDKDDWQKIHKLSGVHLDTHQYTLWLKFIGVLNPDRGPEEARNVAAYIESLKK